MAPPLPASTTESLIKAASWIYFLIHRELWVSAVSADRGRARPRPGLFIRWADTELMCQLIWTIKRSTRIFLRKLLFQLILKWKGRPKRWDEAKNQPGHSATCHHQQYLDLVHSHGVEWKLFINVIFCSCYCTNSLMLCLVPALVPAQTFSKLLFWK